MNLDEARANADFILMACNSHDALVVACEGAYDALVDVLEDTENEAGEQVQNPLLQGIRAAIALATKGEVT